MFSNAVNALSTLYGVRLDQCRVPLEVLGKELNLNAESSVWAQIHDALKYRRDHGPAAMAAIQTLEEHPEVARVLTETMQALRGRFIALFAANKIEAASYHFYGHGEEMSIDPGAFLGALLPNEDIPDFLIATTNALGAAHDIIQGQMAPINERESARIFIDETQEAINTLLENSFLSAAEINALEEYRDSAIPFLANECIVNATYLLFGSGKRNFDNVLTQVYQILVPDALPDLTPCVAAMKMSIALADTRRSEMKHVLARLEMLNSISVEYIPALEQLLRGIQLLDADQNLAQLQRNVHFDLLMKIEGYLLRLGQNIRMRAELAVVFAKPEEREGQKERLQLIRALRANHVVSVCVEGHLYPFLASISGDFGEVAFAKALGAINSTELREQAAFYGLTLNEDNLDLSGWQRHADDLENTRDFLNSEDLSRAEKQKIAMAMYFVAAKPPGHRVSKDTFTAMTTLVHEIKEHVLLKNLHEEMVEIRRATGLESYSVLGKSVGMFRELQVQEPSESILGHIPIRVNNM